MVALIAFMFIFAWMLHIAGADSFIQGVLLSYLYMLVLFAWDTFFLDWILFANIKDYVFRGLSIWKENITRSGST